MLAARRDVYTLCFWGKVVSLQNDRLLRRVYEMARLECKRRKNWCHAVRELLCRYGFQAYWTANALDCTLSQWRKLVADVVYDQGVIDWFRDVAKKPKLNNYSRWKTSFGLEDYLVAMTSKKWRSLISSFRSGSNELAVETGRWEKLERADRVCRVCMDGVEDEEHVVLRCPLYHSIRSRLLQSFDNPALLDRSVLDSVLGSTDGKSLERWNAVGRFLTSAMARRRQMTV